MRPCVSPSRDVLLASSSSSRGVEKRGGGFRRLSTTTTTTTTTIVGRAHGRKKGESIPEDVAVQKLADAVVLLLRGVNVVTIGENETANHQLSELLAPLLNYSPMSVPKLIEDISGGKTREEIARTEGDAEALIVENSVHEQLSQFLRVSLARACC